MEYLTTFCEFYNKIEIFVAELPALGCFLVAFSFFLQCKRALPVMFIYYQQNLLMS